MDNSLELIRLFNELEEFLRQQIGANAGIGFYALVENASRKNSIVRRYSQTLKHFGDFRNIIVHYEKYPPILFAEAHDDVLKEFRKIVERITNPPKVIPAFQKEVKVFEMHEPLRTCLRYMRHNDYSQVVVKNENRHTLLSHDGIARWLGECEEVGLADIEGTNVEDILRFELPRSCGFISRDGSIFDAEDMFIRAVSLGIPRLHAILITQNGKQTEAPFGIVTPWDLLGSQHDCS